MFSSEAEKRTNFLHVRNHVLNSTSLNRCLLELTARKLRCFLKSEIVWFQIKIFYYTICFKEISTLKNNVNRSKNEPKNLQISCIYKTRVVDLPCLNCCLLEFTTRKLRSFVLKNSENCTISKH